MVERKVIWTQTAIDQFKELLFFWQANDVNEKFTKLIITRIEEHIQVVLQFPKCGKPYKMSKKTKKASSQCLFTLIVSR